MTGICEAIHSISFSDFCLFVVLLASFFPSVEWMMPWSATGLLSTVYVLTALDDDVIMT